ncbi:MAG TPA: tetratricopeptide repeat protein [Flavobacteriales bacterium]|nr:tetratricopeptide repeat protein [Flavobacteriales bacterium]
MANTQERSSWTDRIPAWVLSPWFFAVLAIALYVNTTANQFALDDGLVLNENKYVAKGIPGISDILMHDSFHGCIGNSAYLSGGRYRPLSLVTYAIEVSLFGMEPWVHHLGNVLLFAVCCIVLFRFLRRFVLPDHPWAAWSVALLFTVHPVHTEAIANIKGRDEILSLIFLLLTLHHALAHVQWRRLQADGQPESRTKRKQREKAGKNDEGKWSGAWSAVFFALALLSKENGLIFIAVLPLTLYCLGGLTLPDAVRRSAPVLGLVVLYVALRMILLGARNNTVQEVMDNPYLFATAQEKIGSILFVLLLYVKLMFWPHPLVYDYSFNQIPLHGLGDPFVILSACLHIALLVVAVMGSRRRDLLTWCILFYLGTLFLVSNLAFNIGAPLGERFLFQASVPFLIGVVEMVRRIMVRGSTSRSLAMLSAACLLLITAGSAFAVVQRNSEWSNGDDLFLHDVAKSPMSVRTRTFAGIALIHKSDAAGPEEKRGLAWEAVEHLRVADSIHSTYLPTLLNMGMAYYRLDSLEAAEHCWDRSREIDANDPKLKELERFLFDLYYKGGLTAGTKGDYPEAIRQLSKAVKYAPDNADAWYNLGGVLYTTKDLDGARTAWERALELKPDHLQTKQGMFALRAAEQRTN